MDQKEIPQSNEVKEGEQGNSFSSEPDVQNNETERFKKPDLPKIPVAVSERVYRESGDTSLSVIISGVVSGIPVGIILFFLANLALTLAVWFTVDFGINDFVENGNFQYEGILTAVFFGMLLVCMAVIYGYTGFITAFSAKKVMQSKNNRNSNICISIGILSSLTAYLLYLYIGIDITRAWETFEASTWNLFLMKNNIVVYTEHVLASIIVIVGAFIGASSGDKPFCEKCGIWYEKAGQAFFDYSLAEPLLEILISDSPGQYWENLIPFKAKPNIENQVGLNITIWRCPRETVNICDYNVVGELKWKEQKMVKGKVKTYIMSESWLNTMANNQNGKFLSEALFKS